LSAGTMSAPHPPAQKAASVVQHSIASSAIVPTVTEIVSTSSALVPAVATSSAMVPSVIEIVSTSSALAPNTCREVQPGSMAMSFLPLESPSVLAAISADGNTSFIGSTSSPAQSNYRETLGQSAQVPQAYPRASSSRHSPRLQGSRTPFQRSPTGEVPVQRRSSHALSSVPQPVGGSSIRALADDRRGELDGRRKVLAARSLSPQPGVSGHRSPANASREGRSVIVQRETQTRVRDRSTRREVFTHVPGSAVQALGGTRMVQARGSKLGINDLQVGNGKPDPTQPMVRSQLIAELGLSQRATMTPLKGGGQNEGIWMLEDGPRSYVMKLVRHQLPHSATTDADRLVRLASECPNIVDDPALAFPLKMFRCKGPNGSHSHDLLVMRKASGRALTEYVALKWAEGKGAPLVMDLLEKVGGFLADFHKKYGHKQHCDFHPTNLFYDEATGLLTMIDVGSIGASTCTTDMDHFIQGLAIMSRMLGPQFHIDGMTHFRAGYAMSAR